MDYDPVDKSSNSLHAKVIICDQNFYSTSYEISVVEFKEASDSPMIALQISGRLLSNMTIAAIPHDRVFLFACTLATVN